MGTKELTYKEKILYTLDSKIQAAKNDLGKMQEDVVTIQNKVTATMRLVNNLNDARDEIDKIKQREPKADDGPEALREIEDTPDQENRDTFPDPVAA